MGPSLTRPLDSRVCWLESRKRSDLSGDRLPRRIHSPLSKHTSGIHLSTNRESHHFKMTKPKSARRSGLERKKWELGNETRLGIWIDDYSRIGNRKGTYHNSVLPVNEWIMDQLRTSHENQSLLGLGRTEVGRIGRHFVHKLQLVPFWILHVYSTPQSNSIKHMSLHSLSYLL